MVALVVMGGSGGAFVSNVSLLCVCLTLGIGVQAAAPQIHALRGWQKVGANAVMTGLAILALAWVSNPQIVQAKLLIAMECVCYWGWESWCCYF